MSTVVEGLVDIREQILEQIVPLLEASGDGAAERFRLMLQIAKMKGTPDLYQKTFQIAQNLGEEDKLDAYLDLLADIDVKIQEEMEADGMDRPQVDEPLPQQAESVAKPIVVN